MAIPGPSLSKCEMFLHDIGPYPGPYVDSGDSQCDYTKREAYVLYS